MIIALLYITLILSMVIIACNYIIPLFLRLEQNVRSATHGKGYICLTYDDGPDNSLTEALINLLDKEKAKATFFFVGFRTERYPETCDRIKSTQNEIGCHTYMHSKQWKQLPWNVLHDVKMGYEHMAEWLLPNAPFRPPRGKTHLIILVWLSMINAKALWWTHDSLDTKKELPDPKTIVDKVKRFHGGVVLMHSFHKDQNRHEYVLNLTQRLIEMSREERLHLCTASEYLNIIK